MHLFALQENQNVSSKTGEAGTGVSNVLKDVEDNTDSNTESPEKVVLDIMLMQAQHKLGMYAMSNAEAMQVDDTRKLYRVKFQKKYGGPNTPQVPSKSPGAGAGDNDNY